MPAAGAAFRPGAGAAKAGAAGTAAAAGMTGAGGTTGAADKAAAAVTLGDVEKNHILEVLKKTGWKVSGEKGAAKILGLNPTTLEARMKKLGIRRG